MKTMFEAEVAVIGGGPAGVSAAISAAREGVSVILVERYGFLGGMSTAALVSPLMTFHAGDEQIIKGVGQEIIDMLINQGGSFGHVPDPVGFVSTVTPVDAEAMKVVCEKIVLEAGVKIIYHSLVDGVEVQEGRVIAAHLTGKSGKAVVTAKQFVDCTGDGDLIHLAGGEYEFGRNGDGLTQPGSLFLRMGGVDLPKVYAYMRENPDEFFHPLAEQAALPSYVGVCGFFGLITEGRKNRELTIARDRVLFFGGLHPGEVLVNMTRIINCNPTTFHGLTAAEIQGRSQCQELTRFLKKYIPGFSDAYIIQTGVQVGFRESRRIKGLYSLTKEDVIFGKDFSDGVARGAFPIDIHSPVGASLFAEKIKKNRSYSIPYRCLVPIGLKGVHVAGRCISTTHEAHASTRVMATCFATGQAAGTAAAMAVRENTEDVDIKELKKHLRNCGVVL